MKQHISRGEPREPGPDECCGTGCSSCVWDTYYDKVGKYEERRSELEEKIIEIEEEEDDL